MFIKEYCVFIFVVFVPETLSNVISNLSLDKHSCKVTGSAVDETILIRTWSSRSFLNCVIECSQETMCQSVFFDKSSRLCYWNNNIPVTITTTTTCGSLLYLQLHTETRPTSFCCLSFDPTATPEPSTSATPTTTVDPDGFIELPSSGIKVRLIPTPQIQGVAIADCLVFSGSKLAVIDSAAKQQDVQNYLQGLGVSKAYIGLTKTPLNWIWTDLSNLDYTNWASTSGFLKTCAIMDSGDGYQWRSVYCTDSHPYLCQKLFT